MRQRWKDRNDQHTAEETAHIAQATAMDVKERVEETTIDAAKALRVQQNP